MSTSEHNDEKVQPKAGRFRTNGVNLFILLILILEFLISAIAYAFLPARMPTHWNAAGQIDSYAPKILGAFILPLISVAVYLLVRALHVVDPLPDYEGRRANQRIASLVIAATILLVFVMHLTVLAISLHMPVDVTFVASLGISILYVFIGNYLGKVRRNFAGIGIRTPWTLMNDTVWERTHRVGGWVFVIGGVVGILVSFIPLLRIWNVLGITFLIVSICTVYSYIVYRRVMADREGTFPTFPNDSGTHMDDRL